MNSSSREASPAGFLFKWATSNVSEAELNDRFGLLFEEDGGRCWVDVYKPERARCEDQVLFGMQNVHSSSEIDHLGRCDVPFRRISDIGSLVRIVNGNKSAATVLKEKMEFSPPTFYIVRQRNSWSRFFTSQELLECLLGPLTTENRSLPNILTFGVKREDTDIGGPQLWFSPWPSSTSWGGNLSHWDYECGYTLKYIEPTRKPKQYWSWSGRQSSVLYEGRKQKWTLISPSTSMQSQLHRYLQHLESGEACNSFTIHILFVGAAMTYWKPYLAQLTKDTNEQVNRLLATNFDDKVFNLLTVEHRQQWQLMEDRITDMFAMLDSTLDTVSSLEEKYHIFHLGRATVSLEAAKTDQNAFMFHEQGRSLKLIRKQLESLHQRVQSSVLLSSSLLDLESGSSLRKLAEESRIENVAMRKLSEKAQTDGAAVKVITIITMIYLPTTVVTNFFSTSFVYSESGANDNVAVASNWWLLVVVSAPLTLFTFAAWFVLQHKQQCRDRLREGVGWLSSSFQASKEKPECLVQGSKEVVEQMTV